MTRPLAERVRLVLDRRYVRLESGLYPAVQDELADVRRALTSLSDRLELLEAAVTKGEKQAAKGANFVSAEDPHELRKRIFTAYRLANESAQAIERLLQADIILRRDLDALSSDEGDLSQA